MHMAPLERLHDNPWHSNTNGPSIPPPVVPALPAVPVPQPMPLPAYGAVGGNTGGLFGGDESRKLFL